MKTILRFFFGIAKIVIGVVIALFVFAILFIKGCEQSTLRSCNEGKLPASFCAELNK